MNFRGNLDGKLAQGFAGGVFWLLLNAIELKMSDPFRREFQKRKAEEVEERKERKKKVKDSVRDIFNC